MPVAVVARRDEPALAEGAAEKAEALPQTARRREAATSFMVIGC